MPSPSPLQLAEIKPVPEVVTALENLLQRARAGELRSICYSASTTGNSTVSAMVIGEHEQVNAADVNFDLDRLKFMLQLQAQAEATAGQEY